MDKFIVVFMVARADGVFVKHEYAHLSKSDAIHQTMAINGEIADLMEADFDADFRLIVCKENEEANIRA